MRDTNPERNIFLRGVLDLALHIVLAAESCTYEPIRFDYRARLIRVLDAHDVVEPRFLTHGINIDFPTSEPLDQIERLLGIRSRKSPGMIHGAVYRRCE